MYKLLIALGVPALWGGLIWAQTSQPAQKLHRVQRGVLHIVIEGEATFEPVDAQEVRIRPRAYAGELVVTSVAAAGASVKKGDVILEIDPTHLLRDLDAASGELTVAKANYRKATEDARLGDLSDKIALEASQRELDNARTNLKWFDEVDGPNATKGGDIQVKDFKDRMDDQSDELDQLKKMYKTDDLTTATADIVIKRAVRGLERAKEQLPIVQDMARKTKEVANPQTRSGLEIAVKRAEVALAQLQVAQEQGKVAREHAAATAKLALTKAQQKVSDLSTDKDALKVAAGADGVVYYGALVGGQWQNVNPKALRAGEKLAAQQVLMTLITPGKLAAVMVVPENKVSMVQVGAKAQVTPKLLPTLNTKGTVTWIARVAAARGGASGFEVQMDLSGADPRLCPGMTAVTKLAPQKIEGVLVVPANCVKEGKSLVHRGGKDEEREVMVGRSDGKNLEIVDGLAEGEEVLAR